MTELDLRGLRCPLPVIRAQRVLEAGHPGDQLVLTVTDPGAPADLEALAVTRGHRIVSVVQLAPESQESQSPGELGESGESGESYDQATANKAFIANETVWRVVIERG